MNRRDFLKTTAVLAAASALPIPEAQASEPDYYRAQVMLPRMIRIDTIDPVEIRKYLDKMQNELRWSMFIPIVHDEIQFEVSPVSDHEWTEIAFEHLRKGDVFRLVAPDGTIQGAGTRGEICVATEDASLYKMGNGKTTWRVSAEPWDVTGPTLSTET